MLRQWYRRLSGQLVLSHVFVAVVVLAFALGVAQITFRHYLVRSQSIGLSNLGERVARDVGPEFFSTQWTPTTTETVIRLLEGTVRARVFFVDQVGNVVLQAGNSALPTVSVPNSVLSRVLVRGKKYQGILGQESVVAVPIYYGPSTLGPGYGRDLQGAAILEAPLSESSHTADSLTRLLLLGELGAVVMVGALAYAISWRLSRPLDSLRHVVAGTRHAGDPSRLRAVEDEGPLEVQDLAREFNRMEDRIDAQFYQLQRESAARDALMAHVAHDLRTPLTSIRGFLEAMQDGVVTGESQHRAVAVAWEETLRLQRLVDRLLRATRIRSGEPAPMAPLSAAEWVRKTLERVEPVLEEKSLSLEWRERQDATIAGNEDYLVEALVNILDNAVKWSPEGGTITVDTVKAQDYVIIRVTDLGPGIPEELLPRVFERFVTGDVSRQQSSGLGLSIVEEVMHRHHGRVEIHAPQGQGTRVELWLPLLDPETD